MGYTSADIAEILVRRGAVSFRTDPPFRFTSGTLSPIYVDNRLLLGHVNDRNVIVDHFCNIASFAGAQDGFEAVSGTATAGIPWAAFIANRLNLPLSYARSQAKQWGHERNVEGMVQTGQRTLLVEDLAFTAGSLSTAAVNLRESGAKVDTALVIVDYETTKGIEVLNQIGLNLLALTTIREALAAAERSGLIDEEQTLIVHSWLKQL